MSLQVQPVVGNCRRFCQLLFGARQLRRTA